MHYLHIEYIFHAILWKVTTTCIWILKKIKKFFSILAEEMLHAKDYFKHGKLDKDGLVNFIKDVKKNTKLSDEDAAILAASK